MKESSVSAFSLYTVLEGRNEEKEERREDGNK